MDIPCPNPVEPSDSRFHGLTSSGQADKEVIGLVLRALTLSLGERVTPALRARFLPRGKLFGNRLNDFIDLHELLETNLPQIFQQSQK